MRASTAVITSFAYSSTFAISPVPEQLFLDLAVADVADRTYGFAVEPWGTLYYNAVNQGRYGDAIHARYHIDGRSNNGYFLDTNHMGVEEIKIDAIGYHAGYPEIYAEALSFYSRNSDKDTRPEIIEMIRRVPNEAQATGRPLD